MWLVVRPAISPRFFALFSHITSLWEQTSHITLANERKLLGPDFHVVMEKDEISYYEEKPNKNKGFYD